MQDLKTQLKKLFPNPVVVATSKPRHTACNRYLKDCRCGQAVAAAEVTPATADSPAVVVRKCKLVKRSK